MSTLLLLLQPFDTAPPGPVSAVVAMPLSGIVQAVYPNGAEAGPNIGGTLDEQERYAGILQAVYPAGLESAANIGGSVDESCRFGGIVGEG